MKPVYKPRECPVCGKTVAITNAGQYRRHNARGGSLLCDASGTFIPASEVNLPPEVPCVSQDTKTARSAKSSTASSSEKLTAQQILDQNSARMTASADAATAHPTATVPEASHPEPPADVKTTTAPASTPDATADVTQTALPAVDEYVEDLAASQLAAYRGVSEKGRPYFSQPAEVRSGFSQPAHVNPVVTQAKPMNDLGRQLTAALKEIFYQYTNRTGRSSQKTLGPSQVGTPCDRRLAMSLLRMAPVNPGGDNWASFVGTCVHAGLAEMFNWADAGQGRFVTEMEMQYPSIHVPHGTADLLDRTLFMLDDHKAMGQWSLDKLKRVGPSDTYRVQLHVYGFGARMRGERIDYVALIAWPRDKGNLDDLYVWCEPYDPTVARDALARVDRIAAKLEELGGPDGVPASEVAAQFPIKDDCRYCPYHMKDAKDLSNGACNGRS